MSRFVYTLVALCSFIGAAYATPGWMLLLIVVGFVASFAAVLGFAAARIETRSQSAVYVPSPEEVEALKRAQPKPGPRAPAPAVPPAAAPAPAPPARPQAHGTMVISSADLARQRKPPGGSGA